MKEEKKKATNSLMKTNGFEAKDHNLSQFCKVEKIGNYDVVFIWSHNLRNGSCSFFIWFHIWRNIVYYRGCFLFF